MDTIKLYEACCDKLVDDFIAYMWYESWDGYWIGEDAWTCQINDQFWTPYDMYVAMKYKMSPDLVFDRHDDWATEKTTLSLYAYRLWQLKNTQHKLNTEVKQMKS
jgi:hypothetical protein